ncbi:DEAD/DEAH box helicase [Candidatus Micrarchaeota archaeon]|nr:DEAD/DEAH box helicase [Candidatus Micrarchaeota archaeon]
MEGGYFRYDKLQPREYQLRIAETVLKKGNSLVILPTGLGKTAIALLVADKYLQGGKRVLFLAPTRPLCEQHSKSIEELMKLERDDVVLITGKLGAKERASLWNNAKVTVATPQCVKNDLKRGGMELNFGLVVLDEVHRAVGNYAYTFVAEECKKRGLHLLGLTASPGSSREKIEEMSQLLGVKNIEIRDEDDEDVKEYVQPVDIHWETVDLPPEMDEVRKLLEAMIDERLEVMRKFGWINAKGFRSLGKKVLLLARAKIERVSGGVKYMGLSQYAALMNLTHAHELLETEGASTFLEFFKRMEAREKKSKAVVRILRDYRVVQALDKAAKLKVDHPKLEKLHQLIEARKDKMYIVFVQFRDQVKKVVEELNKIPGVRAERFVGKREGVTQEEQKNTIERFRNREFNVLVASSIGEEGLDIPSVDIVIFYEPIPSEIRNIQRRGRAGRTRAGEVIILITKDTRDEAYYWVSRSRERRMRRIVKGMQSRFAGGEMKKAKGQSMLSDFS